MAILCAIILGFGTGGSEVWGCTVDGKDGIVEENNLKINVGDKMANSMTEELFNKIISDVEKIYAPIIAKFGKTLEIERNWSDGTVNAYAQQIGNTWKVSMFGGLARHDTITPDGFALVICHEIGHHLGGAPKKKSFWSTTWASNEGQSDYWGSMKCLRKYMENDDNADIISRETVPDLAKQKCEANFADGKEQDLCKRNSLAGLSLGNLFRALKNLRTQLAFHTPDTAVVSKTDDNHPAPQCRLDTYFNGSICDVDQYTDVDNVNPAIGTCTSSSGHTSGIRPLCWYKPSNSLDSETENENEAEGESLPISSL